MSTEGPGPGTGGPIAGRLLRWTERVLEGVAVAGVSILSVSIVLVVADIVLRSTIHYSILGVVDIVQLCIVAVAFWTIPYAFIRGGHISITLATDWLPPRVNAGLDTVAALCGALFLILITRYGFDQAARAVEYGDKSQTIGIPMLWYWAFLLSGGGLSVIATLAVAVQHLLAALGHPEKAARPRTN